MQKRSEKSLRKSGERRPIMADLISRQDAIDAVYDIVGYLDWEARGEVSYVLSGLPSAQPKNGEWIWSPVADDGTVSGCCNICSFSHVFIGGHTAQYNYCPNCGAKMN